MDEVERLPASVAHMESRIRMQRHHITALLADRQVKITRTKAWYEGREALLREQLRQERTAREEAERKLRVAEAILADREP